LFERIEKKLQQGRRLDAEDGLELLGSADLLALGRLAGRVTLRRRGPKVYYSINRHINYTNICRIGCKFCSFSRAPGRAGGYVLSRQQILEHARQAQQHGATELHIVGGVNPQLPFDYYVELLETIRRHCSRIHIKAFTAVEIIDLAHKTAQTVEDVLLRLMDAGLDSLPGGGAEILSDDYFQQFCPDKPPPAQWLEVHATAHRLGLMTNATMLYGYLEKPQQRIEHLLKIRALQDESLRRGKGHFQCFVPLPHIRPAALQLPLREPPTPVCSAAERIDAPDDLRTIATSRLLLDNIDHIKAFWPMLGLKLAQVALTFGADDLDGTVTEYRVAPQKDDKPIEGVSADHLEQLILEAQRLPAQRSGFYHEAALS